MVEIAFAVPGDLAAPTGGYAYARKLLDLLPAQGVTVRHLELPGSFPHPTKVDLEETRRLLQGCAPPEIVLADGLAYGALPIEVVASIAGPVVALVHHPLALENGLRAPRAAELLASETAALARAQRVIATSPFTGCLLARDFGVAQDRVAVAEPGVEPAARARGTGSPVRLLAVGALSPRKGYDVLVGALGGLEDLDWHLAIAGSTDREPATADRLRGLIDEARLGSRIALAGAVGDEELARLYDAADVFVSSSLFEGYGMVLAEAMARGLPLVASTGGAAAATVPDGAGLKVPPGDVAALRDALRRVIADAPLRQRLADASWAAGQGLPRWSDTAARVAAVLREVAR